MKILRILFINRAARVARIAGHKVQRFARNPAAETPLSRIACRLATLIIFALD